MAGLRPPHAVGLMPAMKLICHPLTAFDPPVRPASSRRSWMDDTPESHAYRCLPLVIGNQHGWEVFTPSGFTARWTGGAGRRPLSRRRHTSQGAQNSRDPGVRWMEAGWRTQMSNSARTNMSTNETRPAMGCSLPIHAGMAGGWGGRQKNSRNRLCQI